jgi:molybdenum cofactor cytidylyltransferase
MYTTGLVLAAGRSSRLGQPKQLLEYRGQTLLDATLNMARSCGFDQLIVALGGASPEVKSTVDLTDCDVVENVHFTTGCSSSIIAALDVVAPQSDGVVLLLGDQPGVDSSTVNDLVKTSCGAPLAVSNYSDGRGHPFWFSRSTFDDLRALHGDKGVWKLIESGRWPVVEVPAEGTVPLDVDTWDDYQRLLETAP